MPNIGTSNLVHFKNKTTMIIIADSNIFMSALVTPTGLVASILAERKKIQYFVPDFLIKEVKEHIPDLIKRLKKEKTEKELLADFKKLLEGITIIDEKDIKKTNTDKAKAIVVDVDYDDYPFIALHLEIKHKIWTLDERLKNGLSEKGYGHFFVSKEDMLSKLYKKKQ